MILYYTYDKAFIKYNGREAKNFAPGSYKGKMSLLIGSRGTKLLINPFIYWFVLITIYLDSKLNLIGFGPSRKLTETY